MDRRTWRELQKLSDDELIDMYDQAAKHTELGVSFIWNELFRRHVERHNRELHKITLKVAVMTAAILVLTAFNVFLVWRMT